MYVIPGYTMLASMATTLMLSLIFMILSHQSGKLYMRFWGASWLICSMMFILDFFNLIGYIPYMAYIMIRQLFALSNAYLFLLGTHHFFRMDVLSAIHAAVLVSALTIFMYPLFPMVYSFFLIPNILLCSGMIIISGCMFVCMSWTQKLPEKMIASLFIIIWSIFINHFGFSMHSTLLANITYFIGLFTVNILILILMIVYFKKLRFLDHKNSQRFRLLVENSSDTMFLYDYIKGRFEYISPGISELIGITPKQLYEIPDRFFDKVNVERIDKDILRIFSRPVEAPGSGTLCLYEDGDIKKWSEIHYIPIRDNTYTVSAVEGILRDITDRKIMEADLEAVEQEKKEFLENISHEIKTPVTLITGYTESMLEKLVPPESVDTYLKIINSKAMMLNTLVDDLSRLSDFTSQELEFKFYELNASNMFRDLIRQAELHIVSSGHIIRTDVNIAPDAVIVADQYRLQQVVSNLLNNAVRHTPDGGVITVSCHSYFNEAMLTASDDIHDVPRGDITFSVSDTGDGIPEKDIPHIFERTFSGGNRIRSGGKKTGLGLYISKQIITQHSGHMNARNNTEGGAEISFTIPYYI